jgi:hypothetical protein
MHCINSKCNEKERIRAFDQGFTCLAAQIAQNLPLIELEGCPMSVRLINSNQKQAKKKLRNSIPYMV